MGFDIYGVNPVMHEVNEDKYPIFNEYDSMDWKEKHKIFDKDKELSDKYWKELNEREEENPGIYFRNNVWWWRRLWQFTCMECDDILNHEDIQGGDNNSGHIITEGKASAVAKRLQERVDDGTAAKFEKEVTKYQESVEKDDNGWPKEDNDFMANYPFSIGNLQHFIAFCSESGGFEIC